MTYESEMSTLKAKRRCECIACRVHLHAFFFDKKCIFISYQIYVALIIQGVQIPRNSGALLCGVKGMAESVTSMMVESGVFEGRVLTNF